LNGFESFELKIQQPMPNMIQITGKPVIAPTGNELEEITIALVFRAEFIKPEEGIIELKKAKDSFQVLPLVKGSGRYMGDFVIVDMSISDVQALADGTTIEARISITLREYAASDRLQQQQAAARKIAFATGDKKPLSVAASQGKS
jgi:phage protein U